ncbi:hypothetical protein BST81_16785 [Leptolyngbya sp. 'hensonii']|uniref:plasmid mobilization protein n=1 Tax=Leptolyngbya sp. 'hensonii' TaxID=1922337 RepID=UPI00094F842E|nr:plasmid mobilization relaxosome protein MobC [Leptolyngbya sp. 'hensonii']OLP17445.1 hypothetical protein BST81_16785 [Leptolyngbya sp. 'hensonii']
MISKNFHKFSSPDEDGSSPKRDSESTKDNSHPIGKHDNAATEQNCNGTEQVNATTSEETEQISLEELLAPLVQDLREIAQNTQDDKARVIKAIRASRKTAKTKMRLASKQSAIPDEIETVDELEVDSGCGGKITFRVDSRELKELAHRCFNQGMDQSEYIRCCVFGYPMPRPRPVMPQINRGIYIELGRVGNNLNQLTRAVHTAILKGQQPITSRVNEVMAIVQSTKQKVDEVRLTISQFMPQLQEEEEP